MRNNHVIQYFFVEFNNIVNLTYFDDLKEIVTEMNEFNNLVSSNCLVQTCPSVHQQHWSIIR